MVTVIASSSVLTANLEFSLSFAFAGGAKRSVSDYRAMDDRSKKFVRMVIDYELERAHPEDAPAMQTARDVLGDKPRNQLAHSDLAQAE